MSKPNPRNSTIIQVLLDLEKALKCSQTANASDMLQHVTALKKLSSIDIKSTDAIFDTHKYPSQSITFVKCTRFTDNQILTLLSANACKLLLFAIQIMSHDNCVLLNQTTLSTVLNMSKPTINKAVDELIDANCIKKIISLKRKNPSGTVYVVNSDIAQIGTRDNNDIFGDSDDTNHYDVVSTKIQLNGKYITFTHPETLKETPTPAETPEPTPEPTPEKMDDIPDFIRELEKDAKQSPVEQNKKKRGKPKKKETA